MRTELKTHADLLKHDGEEVEYTYDGAHKGNYIIHVVHEGSVKLIRIGDEPLHLSSTMGIRLESYNQYVKVILVEEKSLFDKYIKHGNIIQFRDPSLAKCVVITQGDKNELYNKHCKIKRFADVTCETLKNCYGVADWDIIAIYSPEAFPLLFVADFDPTPFLLWEEPKEPTEKDKLLSIIQDAQDKLKALKEELK